MKRPKITLAYAAHVVEQRRYWDAERKRIERLRGPSLLSEAAYIVKAMEAAMKQSATKLRKLDRMTVANGCTPEEAATAKALADKIRTYRAFDREPKGRALQ
jgi:hypothetical protein